MQTKSNNLAQSKADIGSLNTVNIQKSLMTALFTIVLSLIVIISQRADYIWLNTNLGERSITEFSQVLMLIITTVFFYRQKDNAEIKSAVALVCGFFMVLIIRELDVYFDMIIHGFWKVPALLVTAVAITKAIKVAGIANAVNHLNTLLKYNSMQFLIVALILLMVFSRLYGMGDFWKVVMDEHYVRAVKNISEETIELLFYSLIAFAAFRFKQEITQD